MNTSKRKTYVSLILLLLGLQSFAQTLISNLSNRDKASLNGKWQIIIDPYETGYYDYRYQPYDVGKRKHDPSAFYNNSEAQNPQDRIEYDFDQSETINVPGDWNTQKEKLFYYEGSIWYKKSFDYSISSKSNRQYVHFGAVNYQADVYLNGVKLGRHIGGFTPFNFEVTDILKEKDNYLVLKVDNKRHKDAVPTLNTDWWNYGGITRDVNIISVANTYVEDYTIQLQKDSPTEISGFIKLNGAKENQTVSIEIPELKISKSFPTDDNGRVSFSFTSKKIKYWSPQNPKLYEVNITLNNETLTDQIGFRNISTNGYDLLLNGKSIFLRGICTHEENGKGGRAYSNEDALLLLNRVKELGCNFVRLAHYPHNEYMVRLADKMGILLWEEIPVYWTINWENKSTYANAENQLSEVITRDKNRASVIIWSMANETPVGESRNKFLRSLMAHTRSLDNTRLVSAALEVHTSKEYSNSKLPHRKRMKDSMKFISDPKLGELNQIGYRPAIKFIKDPIAQDVDILGFNQYIGWYGGSPASCKDVNWEFTQNKPVIITEFGGGALQGLHGAKNERWTEDYQEELYIQTIDMMKLIPELRGVTPWILTDFRSPKRLLPVIQDGWNRKGLISEVGVKKKAYYVLQKYYQEIKEKAIEKRR